MFVKEPKEGLVKTRLAKHSSTLFALEVYQHCLDDLFLMLEPFELALYAYPDIDFFNYPLLYKQKGDTLGEKMFKAFEQQFEKGYEKIVLIGSDTPQLPANYIRQSFDALDTNDIVLGPSADGGYYLIALKKEMLHKKLFDNVTWSSSLVLEQTLHKVHDKKVHLLSVLNDIDTLEDLKQFYSVYQNTPLKTIGFLKDNGYEKL